MVRDGTLVGDQLIARAKVVVGDAAVDKWLR
jgi:hypothetical protein